MGRFSVLGDPQGASLSVYKPNQGMELHDISKDVEFCWNELTTSDAPAAWKFYSELFGWTHTETVAVADPVGGHRMFAWD